MLVKTGYRLPCPAKCPERLYQDVMRPVILRFVVGVDIKTVLGS